MLVNPDFGQVQT